MELLTAAVLVATPVLAFAGALTGHLLSRRTATELDRWRQREETMRMLRWATELAVDTDPSGTVAHPSAIQVMAAKVRMKADRRLNRETPAEIRAIAESQPVDGSGRRAS